jgi:hypothetical protein
VRGAAARRIAGPIQSASTSEPTAADPTHHTADRPVAVTKTRGADSRSRADVRREHRREDQARAEPTAGDEEISCGLHAATDPKPERNLCRQ